MLPECMNRLNMQRLDTGMPDHFDNSVCSFPVTGRRLRDCLDKKIGIKYIICRTYSSKKGYPFQIDFSYNAEDDDLP